MKESTATILALVTLVAAFYMMDLTATQGISWRSAKKITPVAEPAK